jgi:hypothetical protein
MAWAAKDYYKYNYVPTKYFRTLSNSKFKWTISRTTESTLTMAMNLDGSKYKGGFAATKHQSSGLTWEPQSGNNVRAVWTIKWKYQQERAYCFVGSSSWDPTGGYQFMWIDAWRWIPVSIEAGNKFRDTSATFACGGTGPAYVDQFGAPTTISGGTGVTYRGFFTIAGVSLDISQDDASQQDFKIIPDTGLTATACGNTGTPKYASLVKEIAN